MIRTIILISWFLLTTVLKLPSWISFLVGCVIVLIAGFSVVIDHQGFVLRLLTYAFGFFVIGFMSYVLELKHHEKK